MVCPLNGISTYPSPTLGANINTLDETADCARRPRPTNMLMNKVQTTFLEQYYVIF